MNALQTQTLDVSLIESTNDQRQEFAESIIEQVREGNVNPLDAQLFCKAIEDVAKRIMSDDRFKNELIEEATINGKRFQHKGVKFEVREAGVKYHFDKCDDPILALLQEQKAELDAKLKEREAFLKTVSTSGIDLLTEDGEVIKVFPPYKTSTTTVAVTLK
jgi:triphosphoribosyl-dephospho-CoA synthetase